MKYGLVRRSAAWGLIPHRIGTSAVLFRVVFFNPSSWRNADGGHVMFTDADLGDPPACCLHLFDLLAFLERQFCN